MNEARRALIVGHRLRYLMNKQGHSLRDVEVLAGVPKTTVKRILEGKAANLERWIAKIAPLYGESPSDMMAGNDPRIDFEWSVRSCSPRERFDLCVATIQDRLYQTIQFLSKVAPARCSLMQMAAACNMSPAELGVIITRWSQLPPDLVTTRTLVTGLTKLTGVSEAWFNLGVLGNESGPAVIAEWIPVASQPALNLLRDDRDLTKRIREMALRRLSAPA